MVWSLMYGHAHVIAENREMMKALFSLLDERQLEEAAKIGTYTESQLAQFIKSRDREHDDDDREGDEKVRHHPSSSIVHWGGWCHQLTVVDGQDKSMMDSL